MPVQPVQLVECEGIDETLERLDRKEVAGHIQVEPSPREAWFVFDAQGRQLG